MVHPRPSPNRTLVCTFGAVLLGMGGLLPAIAEDDPDRDTTRRVSLDLLLPPSFQVSEDVEPVTGEAPPNLRPPAFETIQPVPPSQTPVPQPSQIQPVAPPPTVQPVPPPFPVDASTPVVPVDPQAPPPSFPTAPPAPAAPRALPAPVPPPTSPVPQPEYNQVLETVQETRVSTQTEYLQSSPPPAVRPMGRRSSGAGRIIGQRYEVTQAASQSRLDQSTRPIPENAGPVSEGGYFPTQAEAPMLGSGNPDYPRSRGDRGYWGYSGIWPVRSAPDNFYQRNGAFFDRVDRGLGLVMPERNVLFHSPDPDFFNVDFNYGLDFLTQDVAAQRVMLKLGPLYLDFLGVSASVLYTDYSGDLPLPGGVEDDGWISIVGVPIRAALRITDTIYIQSTAFLYFLPGEGEFGVSSGIGSGWALGTNARLNIEWENDPWMFRLYDYFGFTNSLADLFESWEVSEVDAVGRYRFGAEAFDNSTDRGTFWDPRFGGYRNDIGFEFQRPFQNEWWLLGTVMHSDYWAQADLDDHRDLDQFSVLYRYLGDDWMFAPEFGYRGATADHFDTLSHEVYARVTGRLTEYLTVFGQAGFFWQSGENSREDGAITWEVGAVHDLTEYTRHSLSGGQVYTISEQLDEYLAQYVRYTISHSVNERLRMTAYAQHEDARRLGDGEEFRGWKMGAHAGYSLGHETGITAGASYQNRESDLGGVADSEIWTYFASLQRPILARLHGSVTYQYVDQSGAEGGNFTEHLLIMGVNYAY